jgi:branched-chain amino acid transport system substrate-binding protein
MTTRDALLLPLLALLVGTGACQTNGGGGARPTGAAALTLGAIFTETGPLASSTQDQLRGARLAVDEINAAGGVLGGALAIDERNDNQDPALAITDAHELVDQLHVPAIIGANSSSAAVAISGVTIPAKVVELSGSATSPEITTLVDDDFVFRTAASDTLQAKLLSERARDHGFSRMAVIHEPGAYGRGLGFAFALDFAMNGGTVTDVVAYAQSRTSYQDLLSTVYAQEPEAILLVGFPTDAGQIMKDYVSAFAFHQTFWFFTDGTEAQSFVTTVGASNFTFQHEGTGPGASAGDAFTTFENAFVSKYGAQSEGIYTPNDYDAVYLLALAAAQAGSADSVALRDHLRQVANPPGMTFGPGQFAEAAAAIAMGVKINYEGASGPVDLDEHGDAVGTYVLWHVANGAVEIIARGLVP